MFFETVNRATRLIHRTSALIDFGKPLLLHVERRRANGALSTGQTATEHLTASP